ncbi:hypothetical protein [Nitrospirillum viridazoti]|nr:hypothetical protein [Nitrospirillum amazonense]
MSTEKNIQTVADFFAVVGGGDRKDLLSLASARGAGAGLADGLGLVGSRP